MSELKPCQFCGNNILVSELNEWKEDAEKLASLLESQRNAYDLMGRDGVTGITEDGYLKLERALMDHNFLVEKYKTKENNSWNKLSKQVLDENLGAWEELGKAEKK